jgi:hypothetical protein
MYYSVTFGTKKSWDDWHLIPSSRPVINPPPIRTNFLEIPGMDGELDLTEALVGRPTYGNRKGSLEFYVDSDYGTWVERYSEISNYLHGQKMHLVLEDDPTFFYEGRFSVNVWRSEEVRSVIVIDYNLLPFKREITASSELWYWNTFNFETGVIRYYKNIPVSGTLEITVIGTAVATVPTIIASASGFSLLFGGVTYTLLEGVNIIKDIILESGENVMTFTGHGTVTIEYRGGSL